MIFSDVECDLCHQKVPDLGGTADEWESNGDAVNSLMPATLGAGAATKHVCNSCKQSGGAALWKVLQQIAQSAPRQRRP